MRLATKRNSAQIIAILAIGSCGLSAASPSSSLPQWDGPAASELVAYIDTIASHGLDPSGYGLSRLQSALSSQDSPEVAARAASAFAALAHDLADGKVDPSRRESYAVPSAQLSSEAVAELSRQALEGPGIAAVLESLAPHDRQYAALREALAALPARDLQRRRKISVNLERMRWLPRVPGPERIVVNIPEYRLALWRGDEEVLVHSVIVGKRSSPTPRFSATVFAVIFNPAWHVPRSIVAESIGALVRLHPTIARQRGYVWTTDKLAGLSVTQVPGPQNALGQMKLDMPNDFSVYVHDTPDPNLFVRSDRALSHGCVRLEHPLLLGETLLRASGWTQQDTEETLKRGETKRVALPKPIPISIVYLTVVAGPDGRVRYLNDPYRLDPPLEAALAGADRRWPPLAVGDTECTAA